MTRVRHVIKRAGHLPELREEEFTLDYLRNVVGGSIELFQLGHLCGYCNDEGKLLGLQPNFRTPGDYICGTVVIFGAYAGEDEASLTDEDVEVLRILFGGMEEKSS